MNSRCPVRHKTATSEQIRGDRHYFPQIVKISMKDIRVSVLQTFNTFVNAVAQLVEAPCYKPEERRFESRWGHGDSSLP